MHGKTVRGMLRLGDLPDPGRTNTLALYSRYRHGCLVAEQRVEDYTSAGRESRQRIGKRGDQDV